MSTGTGLFLLLAIVFVVGAVFVSVMLGICFGIQKLVDFCKRRESKKRA